MTTPAANAPSRKLSTYESYLNIPELLALQKSADERSHPDELVFQIVHQTFELWWKATVEYLERATLALDAGRAIEAERMLRRAVEAQSVVMPAIRQLEFVAPGDFLVVRTGLGDGSGMDSPGFRGILRTAPKALDALIRLIEREHTTLLGVYSDPAAYPALYACAEDLVDFDESFHLFRAAHLKLAQRNLGLQGIGTGGTPMEMLARTLRDLLFPTLWEVRGALLEQAQAANPADGHGATGHGVS